MTTHPLKSRFALRRSDALESHLEKLRGMKFDSEHRWRWTIAGDVADVSVEADGAIRIALVVPDPMPLSAAMAANHALPGNLRFAGPRGSMLAADTFVDGRAHLPRSFADLEVGILLALGHCPHSFSDKSPTNEQVSAAIGGGNWRDGSVVEMASGWELRPRVRGCATAVHATIEKTELRICRRIVAAQNTSSSYECLCAQALRFNEHLRHARLTVREGALFAESCLHGEQISPTWIETAAWAVAVACRYTEDVFCILTEDAEVVDLYAAVFLGAAK